MADSAAPADKREGFKSGFGGDRGGRGGRGDRGGRGGRGGRGDRGGRGGRGGAGGRGGKDARMRSLRSSQSRNRPKPVSVLASRPSWLSEIPTDTLVSVSSAQRK